MNQVEEDEQKDRSTKKTKDPTMHMGNEEEMTNVFSYKAIVTGNAMAIDGESGSFAVIGNAGEEGNL